MTQPKDKLIACIFSAIENYNTFQATEHQLEKNTNTVLFSRAGFTKQGKLDSMSLVNLLVLIEEKIKLDLDQNFIFDISEVIESKETLLKDFNALIAYLQNKVN